MNEAGLWRKLKSAMQESRIKFQRHEDKWSPNIPDLSFTFPGGHGWIELKMITVVGRYSKTYVPVIKHFTPGQRAWLKTRDDLGKHVFLFLGIEFKDHTAYLLMRGRDCDMVGTLKLCHLFEKSAYSSVGSIDWETFRVILEG